MRITRRTREPETREKQGWPEGGRCGRTVFGLRPTAPSTS